MEEKTEKKTHKLSYEQLEAYAAQTVEQAKKIYQENKALKKALYDVGLREVEVALKCLDHADKFSNEFTQFVVDRIEKIMGPQAEVTDNKEE